MGSYGIDFVAERVDSAIEYIEAEGTDFVGQFAQAASFQNGEYGVRAHKLGAVEQSQTFFRGEFERFEITLLEDFGSLTALTFVQHFAKSEQRQAQVGKGREVAAGAE